MLSCLPSLTLYSVTLPVITEIAGAFNVDTSSSDFDCGSLPGQSSQVVRGSTNCTSPKGTQTEGNGTSSSGTSTGSGSSTSTSGAAVPLDVPAWMTGAGVFGGLVAFLL